MGIKRLWGRLVVAAVLVATVWMGSMQMVRAEETSIVEEVPQAGYTLGRVTAIFDEGERESGGFVEAYQKANVTVLRGEDAGQNVSVEFTTTKELFPRQKLKAGDRVILTSMPGVEGYYVVDHYRMGSVYVLAMLFVLIALVFGRSRGATSLLGLAASFVILVWFVVPQILHGANPLLVSLAGAFAIAIVSILLAHGFNTRSYVAVVATLLALGLAGGFAVFAVGFAQLSGAGTEEAIFLQVGALTNIDLRGLLLGGILIGALGVLDDVTTAQVAAVDEIHNANPALGWQELYRRGISVGKEHIASLVNTLVLAYVGASFPLFLLFAIPGGPPLWVVLNTEYVIEEVVRAFAGGAALMLAVPIATYLAATIFSGVKKAKA